MQWPFPIDQWGKGKAFRCKAADCGAEVNVYVRAKIGFCNCTTGVSDDDELDRISDFDLLGNKLSALGPGRPITVAWMKGRSRSYAVGGAQPHGQSALSVGFNDHCDAIVATALVSHDRPGYHRARRDRIPQQQDRSCAGPRSRLVYSVRARSRRKFGVA